MPDEHLHTILCPHCDTLNALPRTLCRSCSGWLPSQGGGGNPEADDSDEEDPLDALRREIEDDPDSTVIGPSAEAEVEDPFADVEPDFVFGRSEGESAATPSQPQSSESAPLEIPDWLASGPSDDPESLAMDDVEIPDWLRDGESIERGTTTDRPVTGNLPDWLSTVDVDPATAAEEVSPEDAPEWLAGEGGDPISIPEPEPIEEDIPDWLMHETGEFDKEKLQERIDAEQARRETEAEAEALVKDSASDEADSDDIDNAIAAALPPSDVKDWLDQWPDSEEAGAPSAGIDDFSALADQVVPTPVEEDIPDWLVHETGEHSKEEMQKRIEEAEEQRAAEEEAKPATGELPDWLASDSDTATKTDDDAATADKQDIPDWLSEISQGPEPDDDDRDFDRDEFSGWFRQVEEAASGTGPLPHLRSTTDEAPEEDAPVPGWLASGGVDETPAIDVPDWLAEVPQVADTGELSEPVGPEVPSVEDDDIPDWLSELPPGTGQLPDAEVEEVVAEAAQTDDDDALDWLADAIIPVDSTVSDDEEQAEPVAEAASTDDDDDALDWLADAIIPVDSTVSDDEEQAEPVAEAATTDDDDVPDWLAEATATEDSAESAEEEADAEPVAEAASTDDDDDALDWLADAIIPVDSTVSDDEEQAEPIAEAATTDDDDDVPDWLAEATAAEEEADAEPIAEAASTDDDDDVPDWLAEATAAEDSAESAEEEADAEPVAEAATTDDDDDDVPDWLAEATATEDSTESAEEEADAEPVAEAATTDDDDDDVPDWLAAASIPAESADKATLATEPDASTSDDDDDLDWLADLTDEPAKAEEPTEPTEADFAPITDDLDWLADLDSSTESAEATPAETEAEAAGASAADDALVPDWLQGFAGDEASAEAVAPVAEGETDATPGDEPAAVPAAAEAEPEIPDWLSDFSGEEDEYVSPDGPPTLADPVEPPSLDILVGEADVPDWLAGFADGDAESAPTDAPPLMPAPAATGASEADVPDWLAGLDTDAAASPVADTEKDDEPAILAASPLAEVATPETDETPSESDDSVSILPEGFIPAPADVSDDAPDWLADFDLGEFPTGDAAPAIESDDLLGLGGALASVAEDADEEDTGEIDLSAIDLEGSDLPDWLSEAAPGEKTDPVMRPISPDIPAELHALRFEAITSDEPSSEPGKAETVGALKDVSGVIRPEMIFEGQSLEVTRRVDELIMDRGDQDLVEVIDEILAHEGRARPVEEGARTALPLVRWLATLLLLAAVIAATIVGVGFVSAPVPTEGPQAAFDAVRALPDDATVLLAFEYEPQRQAELQPIASALVADIASRGNRTLYAASTQPMGASLAEDALDESGETPAEWVNLGYVAGRDTGVSALVLGGVIDSIIPEADLPSLRDDQPDMIIVLAGQPEDVRVWVEQAAQPTGAPIIAAVSAGAAPMVYPYLQSGQLTALMSGVEDAAAYWTLVGADLTELAPVRNSQALGALVAVVMIVIGGVVYGLFNRRNDEE